MVTTTGNTIDQVIADARLLLNDQGVAGSAFRFSNQILLNALNAGLNELYRYRPDAFIGNFTQGTLTNNPVPQYQLADLNVQPTNTPLPVDSRLFFNPLVFYTVGRTELSDDEFTDTNRAMTLLTSFRQMLVGTEG